MHYSSFPLLSSLYSLSTSIIVSFQFSLSPHSNLNSPPQLSLSISLHSLFTLHSLSTPTLHSHSPLTTSTLHTLTLTHSHSHFHSLSLTRTRTLTLYTLSIHSFPHVHSPHLSLSSYTIDAGEARISGVSNCEFSSKNFLSFHSK
jgi:hypothetical protein